MKENKQRYLRKVANKTKVQVKVPELEEQKIVFEWEQDPDEQLNKNKEKPKKTYFSTENKHNYLAWSTVLKDVQEKNRKRIDEVQQLYKASLISELVKKEQKYQ